MDQHVAELKDRPFSSVPNPDHYFPATSIERARHALAGLVQRDAGPAIVIGRSGTGKSLLCQLLAIRFHHQLAVAAIRCGRLNRRPSLLQALAFELGIPFRNLDSGTLRFAIVNHCRCRDEYGNGFLVLVDEAEQLSCGALDEIRSLSNLCAEGHSRVRVVLFGAPPLEERLTHPRLESFQQRLAGRFYLEPFDEEETARYVVTRLRESGGDPKLLFTRRAIRAVYQATDGIPRLVNLLCDHALNLADVAGQQPLDETAIQEAWADLQQLPPPAARFATPLPGAGNVIEYGPLEESVTFDPESRLDQITRDLVRVKDDSVEHDEDATGGDPHDDQDQGLSSGEDPSESTEPEVELVFDQEPQDGSHDRHELPARQDANVPPPGPSLPAQRPLLHDPFGRAFEDEQVIVAGFASPDRLARPDVRVVHCEEGRSLAARFPSGPLPRTDSPPPVGVFFGLDPIGSRTVSTEHECVPPDLDVQDPKSGYPHTALPAGGEEPAPDREPPVIHRNEQGGEPELLVSTPFVAPSRWHEPSIPSSAKNSIEKHVLPAPPSVQMARRADADAPEHPDHEDLRVSKNRRYKSLFSALSPGE